MDLKVAKIDKNQNPETLKLPKMTFLDHLNSPKLDFTQNRSGSKNIKFQQCQALTSHFESFWSIVCGLKILLHLFQMACLTTCWVTGFVMTSLTLPFATYCENCQCLDPSIAWTTSTKYPVWWHIFEFVKTARTWTNFEIKVVFLVGW